MFLPHDLYINDRKKGIRKCNKWEETSKDPLIPQIIPLPFDFSILRPRRERGRLPSSYIQLRIAYEHLSFLFIIYSMYNFVKSIMKNTVTLMTLSSGVH